MAPPRIFVQHLPTGPDVVRLGGDELRHLRALRLVVGDHLVLFDGTGQEHRGRLTTSNRHGAVVEVLQVRAIDRESPLDLVLASALLKGSRMDTVFEKGTELGVTRFVPLRTERVQGRRDQRPRWTRIVVAAAMQAGRTRIPPIEAPRRLPDALGAFPDALAIVAWEGERSGRLEDLPPGARSVLAITGPEGGLTPAEVEGAVAAGAHVVGLGPRILRAETAAVTLAALCQRRFGDL